MPAEPPTNTTSKRRRAETESHSSDVSGAKGKGKAAPRPSAGRGKRRKAADDSDSDSDAQDAPEPNNSEHDVEPDVVLGEDAAELEAEVNEAAANAQPYKLTAELKRAKWARKSRGKTPEQALAETMKQWRSVHYDHYLAPAVVLPAQPGGRIMHKFVCKFHPSKAVLRADYEDSTTNLKRHAELCDPPETPATEMITAYASGVSYSPSRMRYLIAMWCARRHRPFSIVEDEEFREILHMLYPKVSLPSRFTVSRDIQMIVEDSRDRVKELLTNDIKNKVHLCVDGWTSPNVISFLGITAHWYQDGEIQHIILDFIKLDKAHTGAYLAERLNNCLRAYGLEDRILSITCDNTENNTTMMKELQKLIPQIRGVKVRVRCFAHVLNLVVKAILSPFDRARSRRRKSSQEEESLTNLDDDDDGDEDDEDPGSDEELDDTREAADEAMIDALEDDEVDINPQDVIEGQVAVQKVLKLSTKVWNSPSVRAELSRLVSSEPDLKSEVLVRAVKTRWNTVTEVLDRALKMRNVLGGLCDKVEFNKRDGVRLRRYILSDSEWVIVNELHQLLMPFLYATRKISTSGRALVHEVIPYFDLLTEHVEHFKHNTQLSDAVRAGAQRGRAILDKYYSLTDDSIVYRIAMRYFRRLSWEEEWIEEATAIIRDEWKTRYKPAAPGAAPPAPAPAGAPVPPVASGSQQPAPGHRSAQAAAHTPLHAQSSEEMFVSLSSNRTSTNSDHDPLETYLEDPPRSTIDNPLNFWSLFYDSAEPDSADRALATMALDFLSAQASSTDAERAFSRGRLTVPRLRHSLSDESVRAGTLLGSWARIPTLVPERATIKLIKKSLRKKKQDDAAVAGSSTSAHDVGAAPGGADVIELE
ncbi:hypothetical protein TRAPUB_2358 [Trametes pubescens]|uniref:HAT C-terminal dimerisation domain-containing protein n=1 Tax=Trametes pubescens TaxID=154538 RepID=A0A1M2VGZ2_TRAPU|nr:hypothetical protein TRAPUB_2358 [Trametes pubescens]